MIREIIIPRQREITLKIPDDYIDREVELIVTPIDNKSNDKMIKKKSLKGIFNKYADSSKIDLEDKAWQKHIIKKFKQND